MNSTLNGLSAMRRWLVFVSVTVVVGTILATGWSVLHTRDDAIRAVEEHAKSVANLTAADIEQLFKSMDLSLQGVQRGWTAMSNVILPMGLEDALLFDQSASANSFANMYLTDAEGTITHSLNPLPADVSAQRSRGPAFRSHLDIPDLDLHIGPPSLGPGGRAGIALSRRVVNPDGSFAGVAIGPILMSHLIEVLKLANSNSVGTWLVRADGVLLARNPMNEKDLGVSLTGSPLMMHFARSPEGTFEAHARSNSGDRIVAYKKVAGYPLIVRVAADRTLALKAWRTESALYALIVAVMILLQVGLTILLARHLGEEHRSRIAAAALAGRMEALAHEDTLTQIPNRRSFDARLIHELNMIKRENDRAAILIMDIDHFKLVNDTLGHAAGDKVIGEVADIIVAQLHRKKDLVARYAGDEFAVILPDTDWTGAWKVAEDIRQAVAASCQSDTMPRQVTVSIGISIAYSTNCDPDAIVRQADEALYAAKKAGRNRVAVWTQSGRAA